MLFISPCATSQRERYKISEQNDDGFKVVTVFYKTDDLGSKISVFIRLRRYIKAVKMGLKSLQFDANNYDLMHVHVAHPAARIAARIHQAIRLPYVITEQWTGYTEFDNAFESLPFYNKKLIRKAYSKTRAISGCSQYLVNALVNKGMGHSNQHVLYNIVDIGKDYGLTKFKSDTNIKMLTISDLRDDQKNIKGLIRAFEKLKGVFNNVELHHIGMGQDEETLKEYAKSKNLLDNGVYFHGYIPNTELGKFFAESHFFVLNSNYETFSVANAEALGHGLPVVITKCGAPEEYVTDEVGVLVERENDESMYEGMKYMYENWQKYDPEKLNEYAYSRFSSEVVGEKIINMYNSVL